MNKVKVALAVLAVVGAVAWVAVSSGPAVGIPVGGAPQYIETLESPCVKLTGNTGGDAGVAEVASTADAGTWALQTGGRYRVYSTGKVFLGRGHVATSADIPYDNGAAEEMSFSAPKDTPSTVYVNGAQDVHFCKITTRPGFY